MIRRARGRCLALLVISAIGALPGAILPSAAASGASQHLEGLPLWKLLPTRQFVRLGGGSRARSIWEVFAFREPGSGDRHDVCVQVISASVRDARFVAASRGTPECGRVGSGVKNPILAKTGSRERPRAVIAIVTGTNASRVRMKVSPGAQLGTQLRSIGGARSTKAGVVPFRYAVIMSAQEVCVEQAIGEDSEGVVFETPSVPCEVPPV